MVISSLEQEGGGGGSCGDGPVWGYCPPIVTGDTGTTQPVVRDLSSKTHLNTLLSQEYINFFLFFISASVINEQLFHSFSSVSVLGGLGGFSIVIVRRLISQVLLLLLFFTYIVHMIINISDLDCPRTEDESDVQLNNR